MNNDERRRNDFVFTDKYFREQSTKNALSKLLFRHIYLLVLDKFDANELNLFCKLLYLTTRSIRL